MPKAASRKTAAATGWIWAIAGIPLSFVVFLALQGSAPGNQLTPKGHTRSVASLLSVPHRRKDNKAIKVVGEAKVPNATHTVQWIDDGNGYVGQFLFTHSITHQENHMQSICAAPEW